MIKQLPRQFLLPFANSGSRQPRRAFLDQGPEVQAAVLPFTNRRSEWNYLPFSRFGLLPEIHNAEIAFRSQDVGVCSSVTFTSHFDRKTWVFVRLLLHRRSASGLALALASVFETLIPVLNKHTRSC
jgi:hypothetical protein